MAPQASGVFPDRQAPTGDSFEGVGTCRRWYVRAHDPAQPGSLLRTVVKLRPHRGRYPDSHSIVSG
jgi:hypothetical protein